MQIHECKPLLSPFKVSEWIFWSDLYSYLFIFVFQIYSPILPSFSQINPLIQSLNYPLHFLLFTPIRYSLLPLSVPLSFSHAPFPLSSLPPASPPSGCCTSSRTSPWTLCRPTSAPCNWTTATPLPGWIWARCTSPATSRTMPLSATSTPHAARAAPTPPR